MKVIAEIRHYIEMYRMAGLAFRIMGIAIMIVLSFRVAVMLLLLNVNNPQRVMRHPWPERGKHERQNQK